MEQSDRRKGKNNCIRRNALKDEQLLRCIFPDGSPTLKDVLPGRIPTTEEVTIPVDIDAVIYELEQKINK